MSIIDESEKRRLRGRCDRVCASTGRLRGRAVVRVKTISAMSLMLGLSTVAAQAGTTTPGYASRYDAAIDDFASQHSAGAEMLERRSKYLNAISIASLILGLSVLSAHANGLGENRAWQFDTSFDKANKASVADMIERKKGGYYDSFGTTVNNYNTTNVGTQINCSNTATATGNTATNGLTGNAPSLSTDGSLTATSAGNQSVGNGSEDGGELGGSQDNSGDVTSNVDDNNVNGTVTANMGGNDQALNNTQDNSGTQNAGVDSSTACDIPGSTFTGTVESNVEGAAASVHLN